MDDIHYEWELVDLFDDWQAGGSCNNLDTAKAEGLRYHAQYSDDGPHKLIIREHRTQTVYEVKHYPDTSGKDPSND
jgi:hypothetical protein